MSKGSQPAGQTQMVNPTQLMQQPFLQTGWDAAKNLFQNNPLQYYPGQTLADYIPPNPLLSQAYGDISRTAGSVNAALPNYNAPYNAALGGSMLGTASPAYPYYGGFAAGTSAPQQTFQTLGAQAGDNSNVGMDQLARSASGAYLNANPYIDAMYAAAAEPVTRNYQTAVAPGVAAGFSNAGRYGSGAAGGAAENAWTGLGKQLTDLSSNLYGTQYARERQLQDTAATSYSQLYNQGIGLGLTAAQADQAARQAGAGGLQSGFTSGNAAQLDVLKMYPQFVASQFLGPNASLLAGKGLTDLDQTYRQYQQAQMDDLAKRFYGVQEAPYTTLSKYLANVGQPQTGSTNNPYFQNKLSDTLAGITGAIGIGNGLGGAGGLFGPAAAEAGVDFGGAGLASAAGLSAVEGTTLAPFVAGGGETLATLAPAAAAGWIICTELTRQGKMPRRHWAAGVPVFAAYPERTKNGYYCWAIPTVRHLRKHPNSRYSRFIGTISRWRAENIAAKQGVRGARRLLRGMLVSAIGYPICATLGYFVSPQDWPAVYRETKA